MEQKMVSYANKINTLDFSGFKSTDLDLFMAFCFKIKDQGCREIEIPYSQLMKLADYRHATIDEIHEYLKKPFHKKIFSLSFAVDTEDEYSGWVLFSYYSANKKKKLLTLRVSPDAEKFFNKVLGNFTMFDLAVYGSLKSRYSKLLYQHLCQYRNPKTRSGFWEIPVEDGKSENAPLGIKSLLNIPSSYTNNRIIDKIISPAIKELAPYMTINVTSKRGKGKGRPVVGYRFDFQEIEKKVITINNEDDEKDIERIRKVSGLSASSVRTILNEAEKVDMSLEQVLRLIENVKNTENIKSVGATVVYCIKNGIDGVQSSRKQNKYQNQRQYSSDELNSIERKLIEQSRIKGK